MVETCYKICTGTWVWLVVNAIDIPMITQKAVVYTSGDLKLISSGEYHFDLPPNNKRAAWLIARRDDVKLFQREVVFECGHREVVWLRSI